jgi:hypothetical protein
MRWETENLNPKNHVLSKSFDAENLRKTVEPQPTDNKKRWPKLQSPNFCAAQNRRPKKILQV